MKKVYNYHKALLGGLTLKKRRMRKGWDVTIGGWDARIRGWVCVMSTPLKMEFS